VSNSSDDMAMASLLFEEIQEREDMRRMYLQEKLSRGVWVTDRGDEILIAEMKSSHLRNTIAMIERDGSRCVLGVGEDYLPVLREELGKRSS